MIRSRFFAGLSDLELEALAASAKAVRVRAGEKVDFDLVLVVQGECRNGDSIHVEGPGALFAGGALVMSSAGVVWTWSASKIAPKTLEALRFALEIRDRRRQLVKSLRSSVAFRNTSPALLGRLLETASLVRYAEGRSIC